MDGIVVYSQAQEADYKTNLVSGSYKDSGLARAFKKARQGKTVLIDFTPYAPSNNEPAAFLAAPILSNGQQRQGMGQTGETYLVGPDKLMRSDSNLDPENHTVKASFTRPETGKVDTDASREALDGKSEARIIMDYNGNPVLSAYTPVEVEGLAWALIADIDKAEALAPVKNLQKLMGLIVLVSGVIIVFVALFLLRMVMAPIRVVVDNLKELAQGEGDLTQRLKK